MTSVTGRIKDVKQPRGGYLNPRSFETRILATHEALNPTENIHPSLIGTAVDYLSRLANGAEPETAFSISLCGAVLLERFGVPTRHDAEAALSRLRPHTLPDPSAVIAACSLARYDVAFRAGAHLYNPHAQRQPDLATIANIQTMVARSTAFLSAYGPVTADGFTFDGAYTETVTAGDGDFLTRDTLWDFKVSVKGPTKEHTLQLLTYYLMGKKTSLPQFGTITHLGIYNPRLNTVHRIAVSEVPQRLSPQSAAR